MKKILLILIFILFITNTSFASRQIRVGSRINNSTPDSLLFIDLNKRLGEDNTKLSWDDTNDRLTTDSLLIKSSNTPSSATDTGIQGQIEWDGSYIYVCSATNTWLRTALSTWSVGGALLLETGSYLLLETGNKLLLE